MLFRSVPIADVVHRSGHLPESVGGYPVDSISLGWEERLKTRARRRTDGGVEFATAIERGTVLREGDALVLETVPLLVMVHELPEQVFVISPRDLQECALWSYHIGNAHQPLMIGDDALVCPDIPGVEQVLTYHAIPFTRDLRPFTPVSQGPSHHTGG